MSRVRLVDAGQAPLLARPYYAGGDPGPLVASLATVPELLDVAMPFLGAVLGPGAATFRQKEIVIVRTSALLECRYCFDAHSVVALDAGLSLDEVRVLRGEAPLDGCFGAPAEAALVAWVDVVAGATGPVADSIADEFRRHHPEHVVVELTLLVGATMLLNRYCTALELPTAPATRERLVKAGLA